MASGYHLPIASAVAEQLKARAFVSIVLPTYNGQRYLASSIESCIAQTFQDWELIIVDDASTDDTPRIAAAFAQQDPRITVLRNATNMKLPGALNRGFAAATGDYLTWTSDDNYYRPNALEVMVAYLNGHRDEHMVYADHTVVDEQERLLGKNTVRDPERLVIGNAVGPCFLYRRCVLDRIGGYSEDLFLVEDYDYWLRVLCCFRLAPLHQDLYVYRCHTSSLSARYREKVLIARELAMHRNAPLLCKARPRLGARLHFRAAQFAERRGDWVAERRHILLALRVAPEIVVRCSGATLCRLVFGNTVGQAIITFYLAVKSFVFGTPP